MITFITINIFSAVYETATLHKDPLEIDILPAECQETGTWRMSTVLVL